jgi:short-subunit dehydrogenase
MVTGASAGIGAAYARALARRGYDLLLVARREDKLQALAGELRDQFDCEAEAIPADLSDQAKCQMVAERIQAEPRFEFLVNNAGFGLRPLFYESDLSKQQAMARLHVLAVMHLTHAAAGAMVRRGRGFVVNVSSVAAFLHSPSNVTYCSTKAWLNSFSLGLAAELAHTGVFVQALCPGFTYSEFHDVMEVDRRTVPARWWLGADFVVAESLAALDKHPRRVICIPSLRYKLITAMLRILPCWAINALGRARHRRITQAGLKSQM